MGKLYLSYEYEKYWIKIEGKNFNSQIYFNEDFFEILDFLKEYHAASPDEILHLNVKCRLKNPYMKTLEGLIEVHNKFVRRKRWKEKHKDSK